MIVDSVEDVISTLQAVRNKRALLVPIFSSPTYHVTHNPLCAIYVYTEDDVERIIPIRHTEQIRGFSEHVPEFLALENIFVHDKKQWLQTGGNGAVWDVKTLWWYTYGEAYDESHYPTVAHQFYWRRHAAMPQVNAIIPLQQHLAMCQKIRHYAWPMCINAERSDSYVQFNNTYPETFAQIESAGLAVTETFRMPELIHNGRVYSQYNYHTTTGRPSNAFRGFNFAAMNKEDGTRSAFCSRFDQGALVEMDFDSYHVRLIARLVGYELPTSSIHDYLGRFYFDVAELSDTQREESKAITFRLLYGGIDREFLSIPFFERVNAFVYELWAKWKSKRYIETPIFKRRLNADTLQSMTANKLFNYYLQAVETEVSVQKLRQVQSILTAYQSRIILYTYDSVLFDIEYTEAKILLPKIKNVFEQGNFPVKTKVGDIYDKLKTISVISK
jgi:hypothetical protein